MTTTRYHIFVKYKGGSSLFTTRPTLTECLERLANIANQCDQGTCNVESISVEKTSFG